MIALVPEGARLRVPLDHCVITLSQVHSSECVPFSLEGIVVILRLDSLVNHFHRSPG